MAAIGNELYVGGHDQELRTIDIHSGVEKKESKESRGDINCVRNINDKLAGLGLEDGTIRFWDKGSWSSRRDVRDHKKAVSDIQIDKQGLMMVSVAGKEMIFWNTANCKSMYHYRYDFGTSFPYLRVGACPSHR